MESTDVSPVGFFFNVLQPLLTFTECVFTLPAQHIQDPHRTHKSVLWNPDRWHKVRGHVLQSILRVNNSENLGHVWVFFSAAGTGKLSKNKAEIYIFKKQKVHRTYRWAKNASLQFCVVWSWRMKGEVYVFSKFCLNQLEMHDSCLERVRPGQKI